MELPQNDTYFSDESVGTDFHRNLDLDVVFNLFCFRPCVLLIGFGGRDSIVDRGSHVLPHVGPLQEGSSHVYANCTGFSAVCRVRTCIVPKKVLERSES